MKLSQSQIAYLKDVVKIVVISLLIIIPVRFFVIQSFTVEGSSMFPSYHAGDYILVDKISYNFSEPSRGDVIVFHPPDYENGSHSCAWNYESGTHIKRIIGLPNETLVLEGDNVRIVKTDSEVGIPINEGYIQGSTGIVLGSGSRVIALGEDQYFVMGDNRPQSLDSRCWGTLDKDNIIGKLWVRLWPLGDIEFFDRPEYEI